MKRALLFANGEQPITYPTELSQYDYIACTDGAYHNYLLKTTIIPHFIIGDLDSLHSSPIPSSIEIIHTPDQNRTDFEKALLYLMDKGIDAFDIYGATGRATDHFLGNLSVAKNYYQQYKLTFYDNYCYFFFAEREMTLHNVKNKIISLIPLTTVNQLTIHGFEYPLITADLAFGGLMSLRNKAIADDVTINFSAGDLLIFIAL